MRQVGQDVAASAAGRPAAARRRCGGRCARSRWPPPSASPRRRADDAVQPRVPDHLDDRRHAAPGSPTSAAPGAVELDLASSRWSGCRACPSGAAGGRGCGCRRAGCAARRSTTARLGACASTRNRSHIGARAEPLVAGAARTRPSPPCGVRASSCWRARRSRPASRSSPCRTSRCPSRRPGRSVAVVGGRRQQRLPLGGERRACVRSAGTAAKVIVIGQPWPASTCRCQPPARRARRGRPCAARTSTGSAWRPSSEASAISWCQAGWNSTSSMRWP